MNLFDFILIISIWIICVVLYNSWWLLKWFITVYTPLDEDAEEEEDETNPFSLTEPQNEDLYIDDPKKCLRGYFEREGKQLTLEWLYTCSFESCENGKMK